jgi:hypothetical protein
LRENITPDVDKAATCNENGDDAMNTVTNLLLPPKRRGDRRAMSNDDTILLALILCLDILVDVFRHCRK